MLVRNVNPLRIQAFQQSFPWTAERYAKLFPDCAQPVRAARQALRRLCETGLLCCGEFDVAECSIGEKPLWSSESGTAPDYDALAYTLELRFSQGSKRARVYWPSAEFAKRYGSWSGRDTYPSPHKISHDLLVTDVWVHLWRTSLSLDGDCYWMSERRVQWMLNKENTKGPIPDGLIVGGPRLKAIEIGGNYPAAWLRHHVEQFTEYGWDIAIY